ncbi:SDR family oxidoreductase [Microbacterium oxydans]|uniref:SDR family NAD(P)-dependent oxidoreductase n=1 Tax=unclassified Microbacterium TaxID=2609290 RepID=UPI0014316745|nr:SDR family NAD(P)-dependent oxidoreductase [Microbacterium sp. ISL-59]MBT2497300.1 SDR family oxidoreductase [Microbacterium sp. ISL-59]NJI60054.1 SDR family oxidoreductase [Microbacterium sp. B19(2022)]
MSALPAGLALFDLGGRTALVTGSSQGIGRTLAEGLAGAGATVVVHGRDAAKAAAVAAEIAQGTGAAVHSVVFDVTDSAAVDAGMREVEQLIGTPDILVNNAGVQRRAPIAEFADEDWDALVQTNLSSVFHLSRRVAAGMIARGSGKIIQIGSVQSQLARPSIAAYSATKGAIVMFTKGLCADLAPHGIQANAIAPGYFATALTQPLVDDEEFSAWVRGRTPAGRWGDTRDLVGALLFLAGGASDFVNGQTLFVDGGMTAVV